MKGKYIWLIGENLGRTTNNNSYYFWKYIVNRRDDVEAYFVLAFNLPSLRKYFAMNAAERRRIVWFNSLKHLRLFQRADMLFVTLSWRDVIPYRFWGKNVNSIPTAPLIYLSHGGEGLKKVLRPGNYANNCLLRNCLYTSAPDIIRGFRENGMRPYQLDTFPVMPRWQELCRRILAAPPHEGKRFLWFITWREQDAEHSGEAGYIAAVREVLGNKRLTGFLRDSGARLEIVLHRQMRKEDIRRIRKAMKAYPWCRLSIGSRIDVMQSIVDSDVLITDYSSMGMDFTAVGKPVILFASDLSEYTQYRKFVDLAGYMQHAVTSVPELVEKIVSGDYGINPYFAARTVLMTQERMREVAEGKAIEEMYDDFLKLQRRSVAFLGYDFSGIGGTVTATNAQAEALLEKGCSVRFYPLKQMHPLKNLAPGIPVKPMHRVWRGGRMDRLKSILCRGEKNFSYLKYDPSCAYLSPISGRNMTRLMKTIHADTVISTRESLHFFLLDASSGFIREKLFFFHCPSDWVDREFPGCLKKLQQHGVEKALFVTERNRQALVSKGFTNYASYRVVGNCLSSNRMLDGDEISASSVAHKGIWLLRVSSDRQPALDRLLEYGEYLKAKNISDIRIEVYGDGNRAIWLEQEIAARGLARWIGRHRGTTEVKKTIAEHDFVVDFSESQSFGMPYIEAILNGKAVFAYENEGAADVLAEMPELIWRDFDTLTARIAALEELSAPDRLRQRYDLICQRFSREKIADALLAMAGEAAE